MSIHVDYYDNFAIEVAKSPAPARNKKLTSDDDAVLGDMNPSRVHDVHLGDINPDSAHGAQLGSHQPDRITDAGELGPIARG